MMILDQQTSCSWCRSVPASKSSFDLCRRLLSHDLGLGRVWEKIVMGQYNTPEHVSLAEKQGTAIHGWYLASASPCWFACVAACSLLIVGHQCHHGHPARILQLGMAPTSNLQRHGSDAFGVQIMPCASLLRITTPLEEHSEATCCVVRIVGVRFRLAENSYEGGEDIAPESGVRVIDESLGNAPGKGLSSRQRIAQHGEA